MGWGGPSSPQGGELIGEHLASSWPPITQPWEHVNINFAGLFLNAFWLVVIDAFSHFPHVVSCSSATTGVTIQALLEIISVEGLAATLVSGYGPEFLSQTFHDFCVCSGI